MIYLRHSRVISNDYVKRNFERYIYFFIEVLVFRVAKWFNNND